MRYLSGLVGMWLMLMAPAVFGQGTTSTPIADKTVTGSATLIKAHNGLRYALNCTNNSTTVAVRWGDSSVTATTGQRLPAGTSIEIRTRGAVYMISEGADVTVSCTEEGL